MAGKCLRARPQMELLHRNPITINLYGPERLLLPTLHRLPVLRLGRTLGKLDPDAVRVSDVGQDRLCRTYARLGNIRAPLLEHVYRRTHFFHVYAEVIDARRPLRVGGLQLDKCVPADLNVDERCLSLLISTA